MSLISASSPYHESELKVKVAQLCPICSKGQSKAYFKILVSPSRPWRQALLGSPGGAGLAPPPLPEPRLQVCESLVQPLPVCSPDAGFLAEGSRTLSSQQGTSSPHWPFCEEEH